MFSQPAAAILGRSSSSYSPRLVLVQNHGYSNNAGNSSRGSNSGAFGNTQNNSSKTVGVRPSSAPNGQLDGRIAVPNTSTRRAGDDEQDNNEKPKQFLSRAARKARDSIRGIEVPTNKNGRNNRAGERSLNDSAAVTFGLKKDREDDTFSYTSSAKTHFSVGGGSIASGWGIYRASSDESDDDDLGEASRAIANPIFGNTSRAVGRQPKNKR